ncbi:hypothetical protein CDAR_72591 [Caerostris darwini]|uniref:Uncharacterized protein n=1 Tax=Caerostris darwini TaxID=1538125 RepID=A0AAV4MKV3_9ARAC|nr:hypothetical protein CDAR_72591 [Caerostris darwini]
MVKNGGKKKASDFGYDLMVANALSSYLNDCDINSSISMRGKRTLSSRAFYPTAECSDGIFLREFPPRRCCNRLCVLLLIPNDFYGQVYLRSNR